MVTAGHHITQSAHETQEQLFPQSVPIQAGHSANNVPCGANCGAGTPVP